MGFIAEAESDLTFDRKIKDDEDDTEFEFYGGKLGIVYKDKYILYGLLGSAYYEQEFLDEGSKVKFETEKAFEELCWGIGTTLLLYETELAELGSVLRFGVDGKFRSTDLEVDDITIDGTTYHASSSGVTNVDFEYDDWQVAGAVSLQWRDFIPYVGVKYSDSDGKFKATVSGTTYEDSDIEAEDNVGIFVGMDIVVVESISCNVEYRLIDEEALSLNCSIRF